MTDMTALARWLGQNGFQRVPARRQQAVCFRKHFVRVAFEDLEAEYVTIYVTDPETPRAQLLLWEATFNGAPNAVVQQAIQGALDAVAAALLSKD